MLILIEDSPLFIPSVETENLLRFRLPGSHPGVGVNGFLERNDLDLRRFQSSRFKTRAELAGDLRYLLRRHSITVNSKQPRKVVVAVLAVFPSFEL